MYLLSIPALADNYIWLLHDAAGHALVVDPGEAAPVERVLHERSLTLEAILLTHHHHDHIGGVAALLASHEVPVYAPEDPRIALASRQVQDGDQINLPHPKVQFEVLAVPGHTLSHVAYFGAGRLFCGDTLFSLGCGRLFEGTAEQMLQAFDRFAALPATTEVCAAHEYTAANGRFALSIEPDNAALQSRLQEVAALRKQGLPSLPSRIEQERHCNPFMRVDAPAVINWCRQQSAATARSQRFALLRQAKDHFQE